MGQTVLKLKGYYSAFLLAIKPVQLFLENQGIHPAWFIIALGSM
jgi:hypothetical protein